MAKERAEVKGPEKDRQTWLGNHLRLLRKSQHRTQKDIARELEVGQPFVTRIEHGDYSIKLLTTHAMARAYRAEPQELWRLADALYTGRIDAKVLEKPGDLGVPEPPSKARERRRPGGAQVSTEAELPRPIQPDLAAERKKRRKAARRTRERPEPEPYTSRRRPRG